MENGMEEKQYTFSLEDNFARLEATIEKLERDDISLEEAFQAYSEGMTMLKQCSEQIDRVEKKVLKLSAEGQLEAFENGEQ
ncbi:MAG: exodeoxyribonuclease VII small subunit [bacterium]|nr:exodeoxyribonuclease VII small subunit [bacterium]